MTINNSSQIEKYKTEFAQTIKVYKDLICKPDYEKLHYMKKMVQQLDKIENRPIYVLDLYSTDFFFVSERYMDLLGFHENEPIDFDFFFNALHPDDYSINLVGPAKYLDYLENLYIDEKFDYKLLCDYRLRISSGEFVRVTEQITLLETDTTGKAWMILAICDLSVDQDLKRNSGAILINTKSGEVIFKMGDCNSLLPSRILTKRELEVLKFIAQGLVSKQIADRLGLSINTVNNHRRNILEKTGCSNTFEAMKYLGNFR
jgi:DNA-binding CsgD family transcriptional regulator